MKVLRTRNQVKEAMFNTPRRLNATVDYDVYRWLMKRASERGHSVNLELNLILSAHRHFPGFTADGGKISGVEVIELRRVLQITQEQLGDMIDASPSTISRWENSHGHPSKHLCKLLVQLRSECN